MKNNIKYIIFVMLLLFSLSFGGNFINKLRVPIYTTYSLSVGYDSNIFRLSESEMNDLFDSTNPVVNSKTYDSAFLSPKLIINYKPQLLSKFKTEFNFSVSRNQYPSSGDKSYNIIFSEAHPRASNHRYM